jgi:broad specificity phosphatase PhoE
MPKLTLILVRHGLVEGIHPEKFRGRIDLPLTETGIAQAEASARYLRDQPEIAAVYASPLARCVDTATLIAKPWSLPVQTLDDLIDIDYGVWQGRVRDDVAREDPVRFHAWMTSPSLTIIPKAESLQQVRARLVRALDMLRTRHEGQTAVAVGHDSSNRIMLLTALDMPLSRYWNLRQDPCGISIMTFDADRCTVDRINETAHLPEPLRQH